MMPGSISCDQLQPLGDQLDAHKSGPGDVSSRTTKAKNEPGAHRVEAVVNTIGVVFVAAIAARIATSPAPRGSFATCG